MMLTDEQIQANKDEFIIRLRSITREGAKIDALIAKLENSDFFIAPASTKYHCAFKGGLCYHSLNVCNNIVTINNAKFLNYDLNTLYIVSLLHDFSKMNNYEETIINKKVYTPAGAKRDELGNFEWISTKGYKTRDVEDRFNLCNHETSSEFMIRQFIPLSLEESAAVLVHHGGLSYDSISVDAVGGVYAKYPLAILLHTADLMSTYIDEKE